MIGTVGWQQLLLILVILALLFGARRVSDLGGALGRGIKEFRSEVRDSTTEDENAPEAESATVASVASVDSVAPSEERTEVATGVGTPEREEPRT